MKHIHITGIIPARFDSSRFPGKPLHKILGVSMIQRVYNQCKKSISLNNIVVATDDVRIFEHVKEFGGNVVMTDSSHPSGTDRCLEAAQKFIDLAKTNMKHIVVNIQGDEPLIDPALIDNVANLFLDEHVQIATAATHFKNPEDVANPNTVKIVKSNNNIALYFSRSAIPFFRNANANPSDFLKHIGIYAYTYESLEKICGMKQTFLEISESLEQLRWLENGCQITIAHCDSEGLCVDVPDDIRKVEEFMKLNNLI